MLTGFHWIGHLPDGKCVVLYADPVLKKTHTEVSPVFSAHIDAIRHCRKHHIRLEPVAMAEGARPSPVTYNLKNRLTPRQVKILAALSVKANGSKSSAGGRRSW